MAARPVFLPRTDGERLVQEVMVEFTWNPGFAPVQKKKNIAALHEAALGQGLGTLLEVSTKSDDPLGRALSAFSLQVRTQGLDAVPLECAFQASKMFEGGGPFDDLLGVKPRDARRDPRLQESGRLIGFRFNGQDWPLEPKTVFYDWLYITAAQAVVQDPTRLQGYTGFTDIEFNPSKSINCQARSCAMFVALVSKGMLDDAMVDPESFVRIVKPDVNQQPHSSAPRQGELF